MDHTVLLVNSIMHRKLSPDGATTDCGHIYLIAAYNSFIDPKGCKAELAWLAYL